MTHNISARNTELRNRRSKFGAALLSLRPCIGDVTEDNRKAVRVNNGGALQEADGSERNIVCGAPDTTLHHLTESLSQHLDFATP